MVALEATHHLGVAGAGHRWRARSRSCRPIRVLAAQHGWLSPLPPEGASAIVFRDISKAAEMAAQQGVRAADLRAHGIVDYVIPEFPNAAMEPEAFCVRGGQRSAP